MGCLGICTRYKAQRPLGGERYKEGQKRCSNCEIFVNWEGKRCPCCNTVLRISSRNSINRKQFQEFKMIKRQ